jgi:hypothetical protein
LTDPDANNEEDDANIPPDVPVESTADPNEDRTVAIGGPEGDPAAATSSIVHKSNSIAELVVESIDNRY